MEVDMEEFFRTSDMALATFLKMRGHDVQSLIWDGGSCYWLFRAGDVLLDATDEFLSDDARVNPREFSRLYQLTKREFYEAKDRLAQAR